MRNGIASLPGKLAMMADKLKLKDCNYADTTHYHHTRHDLPGLAFRLKSG